MPLPTSSFFPSPKLTSTTMISTPPLSLERRSSLTGNSSTPKKPPPQIVINPSSNNNNNGSINAAAKRPPIAPLQSRSTMASDVAARKTKLTALGGGSETRLLGRPPNVPLIKPIFLDNYRTINPNYRPLENSPSLKPKPLEASLFVSKAESELSSNCGGSCVSLSISRSPSPYSRRSNSGDDFSQVGSCVSSSTPRKPGPRRVFPQQFSGDDPEQIKHTVQHLEPAPVVFDANMSFFLGTTKQNVRQSVRASPAFQEAETASNYLSGRIKDFLKRTDHVMEEWSGMGKDEVAQKVDLVDKQRRAQSEFIGRSRSAANIHVKGYQILKSNKLPPTSLGRNSRTSSLARESSVLSDSDTIVEDEVSELTCDLQEERSSANHTTERLEVEVSERLKLEKELEYNDKKVKELQETTDKLELELICAKSDIKGGVSEDEDGEHSNGESVNSVYRIKYERAARELEFTKRRLQTQHEHDLEQLVGLKKQLEKKLTDAYEEVEEQRQVVAQWKRKHQKMTNEMNDLRILLEEQSGRNNILEKKQRKFDVECMAIKDAVRFESQAKEKLAHEKEILIAEKFTLEQNLADTKLDLELKEEKLSAMQRELEELSFAGGTEEEIAQLKRSKLDFERRCKEQEEELDELAGQVQLLEQSKLRLEMNIETMRKESRREAQQKEDELEDVRGSMYKKVKALECQLETEHEDRTLLLREKHELERRLINLQEQDRADRANEEAINHKLRRDLKKYKALLKDCQTQLERLKVDSPNKTMIRQMKNQLEDLETARSLAVKAKQTADTELASVQQMLEDAQRGRSDAEEKLNRAARERIELQAQIEENEEEMAELMKRFTATVKQLNAEQSTNSDMEIKVTELELERNSLKEQVAELMTRIEHVENMNDPAMSLTSKRQELRIKELESKLELEVATKTRIEVQYNRNKETIERLQQEMQNIQHKEVQSQDALKRSQKSLRELREEFHSLSAKEQEHIMKRKELDKRLEVSETEAISLKNDLRLALQRITDLQQAMEEGDSDQSDSDVSCSDGSISDYEFRASSLKTRIVPKKELNHLDIQQESRPRRLKSSNGSLASSLDSSDKNADRIDNGGGALGNNSSFA